MGMLYNSMCEILYNTVPRYVRGIKLCYILVLYDMMRV